MHKAGAGGGVILEKSCQLKSRMDVIDMSDREITLEDDMKTRGLNMEPKRWLSDQQEPMLHGPSSLGHCTQVSPRNDDMHNETCRTLEKANPMVKLVLSLAPNPTNMPKSTSSPGSHSLCPEKNI